MISPYFVSVENGMAYTKRNNGLITDFWPDDDDDNLWIEYSASLADIINQAKAKWGDDVDLNTINIESEYVHTSCLTYDRYDAGDYTNFLHITRVNKGE